MNGKNLFCRHNNYLRLLPTSQSIKPTTRTITIIAVQKPALKIPPTTWQDDKATTKVRM